MAQDTLQRSKECYDDLKEAWSDNHARMLEDLHFSNPADPQQWDDEALKARKGRTCLTLDRTNQYIVQVVNDGRKNKPAIDTVPVDSRADVAVSQVYDGLIRHIESRSRAQIAYDTSLEGAARCGVGWIRVLPKVIDSALNLQEIVIARVVDHLSCMIDGTEPDGSDAMNGFAETVMSKKAFERAYPKAKAKSWTPDGKWVTGDTLRICEHQYVREDQSGFLTLQLQDGEEITLPEAEYEKYAANLGYAPMVLRQFQGTRRSVKWVKFNGAEVLEETTFPGQWIGIVPVYGFELTIEGKRDLCGVTRRLMSGQRAYNYERSAMVESVAMQPKAPVLAPAAAIEQYQDHWKTMNTGQPSYLPYDHVDAEGNPIPAPQRLSPPQFPDAFARGGQMAVADMEAGIGMNQAVLGQQNNATSGRQERERKEQGATATYHFTDNQARSIEQVGRIVVGMIPLVMDTQRQAKILGYDGKHSDVMIDPTMTEPSRKRGSKVVAINPNIGTYDVRVRTGPSYTTQREEAADGIETALQAAPAFAPVLMPALIKLRDWPNADKIARQLMAMAPPEVQAIANEGQEDKEQSVPPQLMAKMKQMEQQLQQLSQMLDAGEGELTKLQDENAALKKQRALDTAKLAAQVEADEARESIDRYNAATQRMKVVGELLSRQTPVPMVEEVPLEGDGSLEEVLMMAEPPEMMDQTMQN